MGWNSIWQQVDHRHEQTISHADWAAASSSRKDDLVRSCSRWSRSRLSETGNLLEDLFLFASSSQMPMKFLDKKNKKNTFLHPSESLWPPMGKTQWLTQWCLGPPPEWMSPRPQSAEIFLQRLICPAEVLLSICMIIIWLTNVEQELVKVSHLQKVIEDQLRLIQSNYSSTAKCLASTTNEWKIITRWSGSDVPTRCGLILTHTLQQ